MKEKADSRLPGSSQESHIPQRAAWYMWGCQGTCPEQMTRNQKGLENHGLTKLNTDLGEATLPKEMSALPSCKVASGRTRVEARPPPSSFLDSLKDVSSCGPDGKS